MFIEEIRAMNINKELQNMNCGVLEEEDKTNSSITNDQLCFSANFMHHTKKKRRAKLFNAMMIKSSSRGCIKCRFLNRRRGT
jgi:hypothetical protein